MALSVHDELWNSYVPVYPARTDPWPQTRFAKDVDGRYLGTEVGSASWGIVPGHLRNYISEGANGMIISLRPTGRSGDTEWTQPGYANARERGVFWRPSAGAFGPDQFSEVAINPAYGNISVLAPGVNGKVYRGDAAPSARQDPLSDSCYAAWVYYQKTDDFSRGKPVLSVARYNSGVRTELALVDIPFWSHCMDWWFVQLQVWGQNPVHLRVVTKMPLQVIPGSQSNGPIDFMPNWDDEIVPAYANVVADNQTAGADGRVHVYQDWLNDFATPPQFDVGVFGDWSTFFEPPDNTGIAFPGDAAYTRSNPGRAWSVWEGTDSSAQRILSGQPGIRLNDGGGGIYGAAKFRASELTARDAGQTLPVSLPFGLDATSADASTTTATNVDGTSLDFTAGELGEWTVDAPAASYRLTPAARAQHWTKATLAVDGVDKQVFMVEGSLDIEEDDTMPATTIDGIPATVGVTTSAYARLDASQLANRTRIVVSTDPAGTSRLGIVFSASTSAPAAGTLPAVILGGAGDTLPAALGAVGTGIYVYGKALDASGNVAVQQFA